MRAIVRQSLGLALLGLSACSQSATNDNAVEAQYESAPNCDRMMGAWRAVGPQIDLELTVKQAGDHVSFTRTLGPRSETFLGSCIGDGRIGIKPAERRADQDMQLIYVDAATDLIVYVQRGDTIGLRRAN